MRQCVNEVHCSLAHCLTSSLRIALSLGGGQLRRRGGDFHWRKIARVRAQATGPAAEKVKEVAHEHRRDVPRADHHRSAARALSPPRTARRIPATSLADP